MGRVGSADGGDPGLEQGHGLGVRAWVGVPSACGAPPFRPHLAQGSHMPVW